MSGIVGIINLDGRPVNEDLLSSMLDYLSVSAQDAQNIWIDINLGLGHALLKTTFEAEYEKQPCSLDGDVWVTADARIDGRAELIRLLAASGRSIPEGRPDMDLILHAYHIWGEECIQHLIGDFVFAIWDKREQRLFCARDHFGVKPFYYARFPDCFIFSNLLNCLRIHPTVSDELNDLAVGDYLLFGHNQEPDTTTFLDIQRLPPAHTLSLNAQNKLSVRRYWSLPVEEPINYKQSDQYTHHFKELLSQAVADRLRTNSVAVSMSGGMDSTSVTATAYQILSQNQSPFEISLYTFDTSEIIAEDSEIKYAEMVARRFDLPLERIRFSDGVAETAFSQSKIIPPEPMSERFLDLWVEPYLLIARSSGIELTGQGGDACFYPSMNYFTDLLKRFNVPKLLAETCNFYKEYGSLPPLYFREKLLSNRFVRRPLYSGMVVFPPWLNQDFALQYDLDNRWNDRMAETAVRSNRCHPTRPEAFNNLLSSYWSWHFETYLNPTSFNIPCEVRHPLFDLRLVAYLLRVPPVPWFVNKTLLREAMGDVLPEEVLTRPKSYFSGIKRLNLTEKSVIIEEAGENVKKFEKYIDKNILMRVVGSSDRLTASEIKILTRPLGFIRWIAGVSKGISKIEDYEP